MKDVLLVSGTDVSDIVMTARRVFLRYPQEDKMIVWLIGLFRYLQSLQQILQLIPTDNNKCNS